MEKKLEPSERYLNDWDTKLTDDWIEYAKTVQTSHCRNINANERGAKYSENMIHKIDELVLMHAFGASAKKGPPHSDIRINFNSPQRRVAEKIRKMILKYGKNQDSADGKSYVTIQVISITMMLVDCPDESKQKKSDGNETSENNTPSVAQIAVFRVVTQNNTFCFIDHTGRYYESWNDYLGNNKLPRCKMCYPENGVYKMVEQSSNNVDENNNEETFTLDLQLSESISCTTGKRFTAGALTVVSYLGLAAGVVSIVAAPFTGGASMGAYATYATVTAGWVSFGCMMVGGAANLGSLWDKFWHDESCRTEIASLAMSLLHYGVARYNTRMIDKLKYKVPVTRTELILMTALNCTRFAVDSVMFGITFARLIRKACTEGISSITPTELVQFSMSAYFFGKTVFEPKTGYGIIKEAQQRYVMLEKRSTIEDAGAQKKFDEFVDPEKKRFGDDSAMQTVKDDWKGITCSQEVCDELNGNGDLIRNINGIEDLNQFFLEVSDTNSTLSMTNDGKIMVNEQFKTDGKKLNDFGETKGGVNERRRTLLEGTALIRQAKADQASASGSQHKSQMDSANGNFKKGEDMLKTLLEPPEPTCNAFVGFFKRVLAPITGKTESKPSVMESVQSMMKCDPTTVGSVTNITATPPTGTGSVTSAATTRPGLTSSIKNKAKEISDMVDSALVPVSKIAAAATTVTMTTEKATNAFKSVVDAKDKIYNMMKPQGQRCANSGTSNESHQTSREMQGNQSGEQRQHSTSNSASSSQVQNNRQGDDDQGRRQTSSPHQTNRSRPGSREPRTSRSAGNQDSSRSFNGNVDSVKEANMEIATAIIKCLENQTGSSEVPANARNDIIKRLQQLTMFNQFYCKCTSESGVVQVDFEFEGISGGRNDWQLTITIDVDMPLDDGPRMNYKVRINTRKVQVGHAYLPEGHLDIGRPGTNDDDQLQDIEKEAGNKGFDREQGGGSMRWKFSEKKLRRS